MEKLTWRNDGTVKMVSFVALALSIYAAIGFVIAYGAERLFALCS